MNRFVFSLLLRSMLDRWFSLLLVVFSLALAVALFLSVQNIQRITKTNFENSIADVDLVVAARGSEIQILLNAVFGVGQSASLLSAEGLNKVSRLPEVAWVAPLSLGDSHHGFRVIGTSDDMFEHALPGAGNKTLRFSSVLEAVVGGDVSTALNYQRGDDIILQHGVGEYGSQHDDLPLRVTGILEKTGTPFDRAIFIPIEASEALHRGWQGGRRIAKISPDQVENRREKDEHHETDDHHDEHHDGHHDEDEAHHDEAHHDEAHDHAGGLDAIDAIFVGLKDKRALVRVQRDIADIEQEALMAVIPGVALSRIWQIIGNVDIAFRAINLLILVLALLLMVALTLANSENRRREMATLRTLGAAPTILVGLMVSEACLLALAASIFGFFMAGGLSVLAHSLVFDNFGFLVQMPPYFDGLKIGLYLVPAAVLANLVAIVRTYRATISDGIMVQR